MSQKLTDELFDECEKVKKESGGKIPIWDRLMAIAKEKYGIDFDHKDQIRDAVRKRERTLGLKSECEIQHFDTNTKIPKIAVFDLESLPNIVYTWGLFDQNISLDQIVENSCLCSWSAKLLNDNKQYGDVLTSEEALSRNDERIAKSMWDFMDDCKIIIAHNGRQFDVPMANTSFLKHGLQPTNKFQIIDTLSVARSTFKFTSNKLDFISKYLGYSGKLEHSGFKLWRDCCNGDEDALDLMLKYNFEDCIQTENVYYRLRPFIQGHPSLSLYAESDGKTCPRCMSERLTENGEYTAPSAGIYKSVRCNNCGGVLRSKVNEISKEKRKNLLVQ